MNAHSKFVPLTSGLFRKRVTEDVTDRRGKVRTIKFYTGFNKGRLYPRYASKRQLARQTDREWTVDRGY